MLDRKTSHLSADPQNCRACELAKATRAHSRRRQTPGVTVCPSDADLLPVGVCFHIDHWTMKHNSGASMVAKSALAILYERTSFKGALPMDTRSHEEVIQQLRQFDGFEDGQQARRRWTDCAPEFKLASAEVRKTRGVAHCTSQPYRPQANGVIECSNRAVMEGANAALCAAGASAKWRVCAWGWPQPCSD